MEIPQADIQWSKRLFAALSEGATWGVPRSGLIFRRRGNKLVLTERMPYTPEMSEGFGRGANVPASPTDLARYQQSDVDAIFDRFKAAGVEVEDLTTQKGK